MGPKFRQALASEDYKLVEAALNKMEKKLPNSMRGLAGRRYYLPELRREWGSVQTHTIRNVVVRIPLMTFVHGDLSSIQDKGPFDLLYLSNALEHRKANGGGITTAEIKGLLAPKGLLLCTQGHGRRSNNLLASFRKLKECRGFRTSWYHELYRVE
jgi:hypothetical protein